jgi:hypothetical protein
MMRANSCVPHMGQWWCVLAQNCDGSAAPKLFASCARRHSKTHWICSALEDSGDTL